jgi:hypothetical protein
MKGKTAFILTELLVVERVKCVRPQSARGLAHSTTLREI